MHFSGQSKFQKVDVVSCAQGEVLLLDGKTQSSSADEHVYHEALVHPILSAHPNPERVFIGGGGEGATAREILRFKGVKHVLMVDIDDYVMRTCQEYLPAHSDGAFDDPRLELIVGDALAGLRDASEPFDIIVLDLADPIQGGPCWNLYTKSFYELVKSKLRPGGMMVSQVGGASLANHTEVMTPVAHTIEHVFCNVQMYLADVPSFCMPSALPWPRWSSRSN